MKLPYPLKKEECARLKIGATVIKVALVRENLSNLKPGEPVETSKCQFKIVLSAYREYDSYHELVLNEGLHAVAPRAKTIGEATALLRKGQPEKDSGVKSIAAFVLERAD